MDELAMLRDVAEKMNDEILKLRKQLEIATSTLEEIGYPGYLTPWYQPWQVSRMALDKMKEIK